MVNTLVIPHIKLCKLHSICTYCGKVEIFVYAMYIDKFFTVTPSIKISYIFLYFSISSKQ